MSAPLSILHITTASDRVAGAERVLEGIARLGGSVGWTMRFVFLAGQGAFSRLLRDTGWPVEELGVTGATSAAMGLLQLEKRLLSERFDIVHAHLYHASVMAAAAAAPLRLAGGPRLVETRHYADFHRLFGAGGREALDGWAARRCDGIIAVSEAARAQLVEVEGVPADRIEVIENGVDAQALAAIDVGPGRRALTDAGVPEAARLVVCAATFGEQKGHAYLLRAFARVVATAPDARLVLLGKGELERPMRALAGELGLSRHIYFLGHRHDSPSIVRAAAVYVQPSINEGFGLALVEAMAMGRAVVASATGGMLRTVEHGVSGLHVPPRDEPALAEAIIGLLGDEPRRRDLGAAAVARVADRFSIARMMEAYDGFYRRVIDRR